MSAWALSDLGLFQITEALKRITTLTLLDLKRTNITCVSLIDLLSNCSSLKKVGLKYNRNLSSGIVALADVLPNFANLEYLELTACNVNTTGIQKICEKLDSTNITTIGTVNDVYLLLLLLLLF